MHFNLKTRPANLNFIVILVLLNIGLSFYATPITDFGDASSYIALSKAFMGESVDLNVQNRSPLYSIVMAGMMLVFGDPLLPRAMVMLQYMLVAVTAWLLYLIFSRVFKSKFPAMLVALLFNLSFSTIYFANILLTEILSVFLLILAVHLLLRVFDCFSLMRVIVLSIAIGLLSLARFNAIPLAVTFFVLLNLIFFLRRIPVKKWLLAMGAFIICYTLIINLWSLYNSQHHGVYRLFAQGGVGGGAPLNITIASIRPGNIVSDKNKRVLEILLKAREEYLAREVDILKGSFSGLDRSGILRDLFSGNAIYKLARPDLKTYFHSMENDGSSALKPDFNEFLKEIATQNRRFIWKYRFLSFLNGFRAASGGSLPVEYGKINLNILPNVLFRIHKLVHVFISVFVFIAFFFFVFAAIKNKFNPDIGLLTMFFVVFSFWGINFLFYTLGDANRYKFPAEPLVIGLFVYYINELACRTKIGAGFLKKKA